MAKEEVVEKESKSWISTALVVGAVFLILLMAVVIIILLSSKEIVFSGKGFGIFGICLFLTCVSILGTILFIIYSNTQKEKVALNKIIKQVQDEYLNQGVFLYDLGYHSRTKWGHKKKGFAFTLSTRQRIGLTDPPKETMFNFYFSGEDMITPTKDRELTHNEWMQKLNSMYFEEYGLPLETGEPPTRARAGTITEVEKQGTSIINQLQGLGDKK